MSFLTLTRKIGESIIIDRNIRVFVTSIDGNQVKISVEAPKHISIHRQEIQDKIDQGVPHKNARYDDENRWNR